MASRTAIQDFRSSWNQTAAWAQSQGISYNHYFPIYQMDSQRLLQYGSAMSQSERERAIQAAANINQVTQKTPSTAATPGNVVGNTITDLRNIFTGVGDIVIHPLHNGLVDSMKNTFDLLDGSHHLTGATGLNKIGDALTSTVLSWVPGVADLGTVLQAKDPMAGFEALAEHPVSSILDVLPWANKAVALKVGSDATFAARTGLSDAGVTVKPSLGRAVAGYIKNTETSKIGKIAGGTDVGKMTIGDRWENLKGNGVGNKAIADAAYGSEVMPSHYTTEERAIWADAENSTMNLKDTQKEALHEVFDPTSRVPIESRIESEPDPQVQQAARDLLNGPLRFHREEVLAADKITILTDPKTGIARIYSITDHKNVVDARDGYVDATKTIMDLLPGFEKTAAQSTQAAALVTKHADGLEQARQAAAQVKDQENFQVRLPGMKRRLTGIARQSSIDAVFGDGGFISAIRAKAQAGQLEDVVSLGKSADRKLSKWEARSVDMADHPEFQAVKTELDSLVKSAEVSLKLRKRAEDAVYGKAVKWFSGKGDRDAQARAQKEALHRSHVDQRDQLRKAKTANKDKVKAAVDQKKKEIRARVDWDIATQRAQIKQATQDIKDAFELEKAKATTRHLAAREAHQAWIAGRRAQGEVIPRDTEGQLASGHAINEGRPGSKSAEMSDHASIEQAKQAAIQKVVAQFPDEATLLAKRDVEIRDAEAVETKMLKTIDREYQSEASKLGVRQSEAAKALADHHQGLRERNGAVSKAYQEWNAARKKFSQAVWNHPPDVFTDIYFKAFADNLMKHEGNQELLAKTETMLAEKHDWGKPQIQALRQNGAVVAQLAELAVKGAFAHPVFTDLDAKVIQEAADSAKNEVRRLMDEGLEPQYLPHVSSSQIRADETGSYGIRLLVGHGVPKLDAGSARVWGFGQSRFDIMAAGHRGTKQVLDRHATIDYVEKYLSPRVVKSQDLMDRVMKFYPDEVANLRGSDLLDFVNARQSEWGLVKFDPQAMFGFTMPRWGADAVYLDASLVKAVQKLTARGELPTAGLYDKATKLFRYSILGLSPRYTAHILFGGSFLLALRSSPYMLKFIGDAHRMVKGGEMPEELATHNTNLGTTDYQLRPLNHRKGVNIAHLIGQEHIEKVQGVKLAAATPLHWLKAMADLNLRFTAHISNMQRAIAYLDGAAKAERDGIVDEFGNKVAMTPERMMYEGMHHAEQVMGDLRRMSPLERTVARTVVPFYGWEKHILKYVLSFPADHPWRAMMLANMAEYDTTHESGGLPSRFQFLFFLGHPDAQGNVSALDFRAMNPLRDVANYATLGGLISSLNPIITSAFAMVDPSVTFGDNQLYPNLTYDQFYGIEEAPAQGNLLTAAEGIVPQISALQQAMKVAGAAHGANTASAVKAIYESLNVPMVQVQHINLRQEAARTAMAQYQVTKNLASNAWQSGDFSSIQDLGSVPDPRNPEYETSVSELEKLYAQLAQQYPGESPASVAVAPPSVHL